MSLPSEKEIIDWLNKKDRLALMDLVNLMKTDKHPVIMSNNDYEFYIKCMDELRQIKYHIEEVFKFVK